MVVTTLCSCLLFYISPPYFCMILVLTYESVKRFRNIRLSMGTSYCHPSMKGLCYFHHVSFPPFQAWNYSSTALGSLYLENPPQEFSLVTPPRRSPWGQLHGTTSSHGRNTSLYAANTSAFLTQAKGLGPSRRFETYIRY